MKLILTLSLFIGLFASIGNAEQNSSEFYFQPKGGANSLEVGLTMMNGSTDIKSSGVKVSTLDLNYSTMNLTYLFGLADGVAFGLSVNNGTTKSTSTLVSGTALESKSTGMSDLTAKFVGFRDLSNMSLRYGGDLGISPGNAKAASSTNDGNRFSGGASLSPYVALEMGDASLHYGLGLKYYYKMTRKTNSAGSPTTTSETTGGSTFEVSPYIEAKVGPGQLSAMIELGSTAKSASTDPAGIVTDTAASSSTFLEVNYSYDLNPAFALIGYLGYFSSSLPASSTIDKIDLSLMAYGVSGRFTF